MTRALIAGLVAAGVAAPALQAQETVLSATVSQRFEADTNLDLDPDSPGTSFFTESRIALGLLRETQNQALRFGFDTGIRATWPADDDFEFTVASPWTAEASYRSEWASGNLLTDFRLRERRFDFLEPLTFQEVIVDDEILLIPDDIDRRARDAIERRYDAGIALAFGTDAPSSYTLALRGTAFTFDDADAAVERQEVRADAGWRLRVTPLISTAVDASFRLTDIDDDPDTTIRDADVTVGLVLEPSDRLSYNFGVGVGFRERRETVGGSRETVEDSTGLVLRGGLNYQVDELIGILADVRVSEAGDRVTGNVRASYALPLGSISAGLSQDLSGSITGDEVRVTRASLGLTQALDELTSVSFAADYRLQSNRDADVSDINRADFTATLNRTIGETVFASVGYRFRYFDQDDSASSNAVFFTIGSRFETPF